MSHEYIEPKAGDKRTTTVLHFYGIYEVSLGYGGPEEGGWYFDSGSIQKYSDLLSIGYPKDAELPFGCVAMEAEQEFIGSTLDDEGYEVYAGWGEPEICEGEWAKIREINERITAILEESVNKGRRPKHSVLSSGVCEFRSFRDALPSGFPHQTPRYE